MFVFKGISSIDMDVIIEEEEQFLGKASQRYVQTDIEGYDGAYFEEQGYSTIERPIKIQILNDEKLDKIFKWLDGVGELEYKGRITKARFYADLDPVRNASIKIIETNFIRDPFWYKKRDEYIEVKDIATNEGTIYSEPLIRLEKKQTDKIDITIGDVRFTYNFKGENYGEINCKEGIAE